MPDLGAHAGFILAAYGVTAAAVAGLIGWVALDHRHLRATLAELDSRGLRRRSAREPAKEPVLQDSTVQGSPQ